MDTRECEIHMKSGSLFCIFISGPLKIFPDISNLQSSVISHPDCCNKSVKKVVNDKKHVFIRKLTHNYSRNPFQEQWTTLHDYFNTWFWYTNTLISLSATVLVSRMFQLVLFCFFYLCHFCHQNLKIIIFWVLHYISKKSARLLIGQFSLNQAMAIELMGLIADWPAFRRALIKVIHSSESCSTEPLLYYSTPHYHAVPKTLSMLSLFLLFPQLKCAKRGKWHKPELLFLNV